MSDEEMEFSDDDYDDYYGVEYDGDVDHVDPEKSDPEYFDCACLTDTEVERLLNESVEQLSNSIQVSTGVCSVLGVFLFFGVMLIHLFFFFFL